MKFNYCVFNLIFVQLIKNVLKERFKTQLCKLLFNVG